ncbi:MAG: winged helix-turn-helix domain-containing protein, partial [Thermoanaerobaculia bacterium]
MGTRKGKSPPAGLAGALFTPVQQRVLGLLFGQPERRFQSAEIIRLAAGGTGAAHRQLLKLEKVGLVTARREGSQKYYQANPKSPIYSELHGLIVKTVGLAEPLRAALAPFAKQIELAFVFGSIAKRTDRAQ